MFRGLGGAGRGGVIVKVPTPSATARPCVSVVVGDTPSHSTTAALARADGAVRKA